MLMVMGSLLKVRSCGQNYTGEECLLSTSYIPGLILPSPPLLLFLSLSFSFLIQNVGWLSNLSTLGMLDPNRSIS